MSHNYMANISIELLSCQLKSLILLQLSLSKLCKTHDLLPSKFLQSNFFLSILNTFTIPIGLICLIANHVDFFLPGLRMFLGSPLLYFLSLRNIFSFLHSRAAPPWLLFRTSASFAIQDTGTGHKLFYAFFFYLLLISFVMERASRSQLLLNLWAKLMCN